MLTHIDIGTSRMEEMLNFYESVFGIQFTPIMDNDSSVQRAKMGNIHFLLASHDKAFTEPEQEGVHQFHWATEDLAGFVDHVRGLGIDCVEVKFEPSVEKYCFRDPDGSPWIVHSLKGWKGTQSLDLLLFPMESLLS